MTNMGGLTPAQKPPRRGEVSFQFWLWWTENELPRISTTQGRCSCRPLKVCFLYPWLGVEFSYMEPDYTGFPTACTHWHRSSQDPMGHLTMEYAL